MRVRPIRKRGVEQRTFTVKGYGCCENGSFVEREERDVVPSSFVDHESAIGTITRAARTVSHGGMERV
jgi:hypothetical protein